MLSGLSLIGNFVQRPIRVGDIVINDDGQHLLWGNIQDLLPGFSLEGKTAVSTKSDLKYTVESGVIITVGGNGGTVLAKGEVQLRFGEANSAFVSLKEVRRTCIKLGMVDDELKLFWKKRGFDKLTNRFKYHFISEVIEAQSGTVIFSEDKGNRVLLKARNNMPITDLGVIANGQVESAGNAKSTLEIISETPIQPLYSAVRYRGNDRFELVG